MSIRQLAMVIAFVLAFLYLFVLQLQAVWPFTIDDMYISLRYARHWASGIGLLWNMGEPPVEGYSNFSFVLLARMALSLGLNPVIVLKSAGALGLLFTCVASYLISRFWFSARIALIPCFWLLLYRGEILWTISGLETAVYQALICWVVLLIFKGLGYRAYPEPKGGVRRLPLIMAAVLCAVAGMTRPEAPALMILFILLIAMNRPQPEKRDFWPNFIIFCASLFICFAPYFLWRWHYYGRFFPNSVYCKGLSNHVYFGLDKHYLNLVWPFILLAIPAIWRSKDRRHYFLWLPSVVYTVLLIGADTVVAFANRLFLPAFALLLPLSLLGLRGLIACYLRKKQDEVDALILYFAAFLLAFFFIPAMTLAEYREFSRYPQAGEQLRHDVAVWLEANTPVTSHVVLADSGLVPYYSQRKFIDSYCLNNAEMTQDPSPLMYERFCKKILQTKPEIIILTLLIEQGEMIYTPADACLAPLLKSGKDYQPLVSLSTKNKDSEYRYEIFGQKKPRLINR